MVESIILESANGGGKSTLGKELSRILDMPYHHAGPSPGDSTGAFKACLSQLALLKQGVIMDRVTPISRLVYEEPLKDKERFMLELFQKEMLECSNVVYCTGEGYFTDKDYYPVGHFTKVLEDKEKIRSKYDKVFTEIPHYRYDWRVDNINNLLERLRDEEIHRI